MSTRSSLSSPTQDCLYNINLWYMVFNLWLKLLYCGDEKEDEGFRKRDNTNAEAHWRKKIRDTGFFRGEFTSMDGEDLDYDLINFNSKCLENKRRYCESFPDNYKCERIFFTPEDRRKYNDISSKTKAEISVMIVSTIQLIAEEGGETEAQILRNTWLKEIKSGKKAMYLEFYRDCVISLEEIQEKQTTCKLFILHALGKTNVFFLTFYLSSRKNLNISHEPNNYTLGFPFHTQPKVLFLALQLLHKFCISSRCPYRPEHLPFLQN
ncbi:uncharacterized protein LOC132750467 isoform X2 [Ruditapes philippinarum]|nr:uncharacterized protein LOC132750467 isoform X2 [Ruditapes philippinarum]